MRTCGYLRETFDLHSPDFKPEVTVGIIVADLKEYMGHLDLGMRLFKSSREREAREAAAKLIEELELESSGPTKKKKNKNKNKKKNKKNKSKNKETSPSMNMMDSIGEGLVEMEQDMMLHSVECGLRDLELEFGSEVSVF